MRGHDQIIAARLAGLPLKRIDIDVGGKAHGIENVCGELVGLLAVEEKPSAARLDLRCCHGLPVVVIADTYEAGWPIAERVIEHAPVSLTFAAEDMAATYTPQGGLQAWEL